MHEVFLGDCLYCFDDRSVSVYVRGGFGEVAGVGQCIQGFDDACASNLEYGCIADVIDFYAMDVDALVYVEVHLNPSLKIELNRLVQVVVVIGIDFIIGVRHGDTFTCVEGPSPSICAYI